MTTTDDTPAPSTPESISLRMTWESAVPMLCLVLTDGAPKGQADAKAELVRCARQADRVRGMAELVASRAAELAEARDVMRAALAELRAPHYGDPDTVRDHAADAAERLAAYLAGVAAAPAAEATRD